MNNQRGAIFPLLVIILLIAGIFITTKLVDIPQILRSKASNSAPNFEFVGPNVKNGNVASSSDIQIKVNYPVKPQKEGSDSEKQAEIKVLILRYFPLNSTGTAIDVRQTGPVASEAISGLKVLTDQAASDLAKNLTEASRYRGYSQENLPYLRFNLLKTLDFNQPVPTVLLGGTNKNSGEPIPNYQKILTDVNICDYVDKQGVDQVWMYSYHSAEVSPVESNMAMGKKSAKYWNMVRFQGKSLWEKQYKDVVIKEGKTIDSNRDTVYGDVSNSGLFDDMLICDSTYALYNYSYSPGDLGNGFHNHGHQIEILFKFLEPELALNFFQSDHCGDVHSPSNTIKSVKEYDYDNSRVVSSDCQDFRGFTSGQTNDVSCQSWKGCGKGLKAQTDYLVWWMQNIPGFNNKISYKDGYIRNFWEAYADLDRVLLEQGQTLKISAYAKSSLALEETFPTHFRISNGKDGLPYAQIQEFTPAQVVDWKLNSKAGKKMVFVQFKKDAIWEEPISRDIYLEFSTDSTLTVSPSLVLPGEKVTFSEAAPRLNREIITITLYHQELGINRVIGQLDPSNNWQLEWVVDDLNPEVYNLRFERIFTATRVDIDVSNDILPPEYRERFTEYFLVIASDVTVPPPEHEPPPSDSR